MRIPRPGGEGGKDVLRCWRSKRGLKDRHDEYIFVGRSFRGGYISSREHAFALSDSIQGQHPTRRCSELHPGAASSYLP